VKITNKKAYHKYNILESLEAGIVLDGAEVKSLRANRADLSESFARIENGQVLLKNAYIYPYQGVDATTYDPRRDRKLLLHKTQISTLIGKISGSNIALVPISIYETHNFFKVQLGLAQTKKKYDHRKALKERDEKRKIEQELRGKV
jgi:SsrA-binding protein